MELNQHLNVPFTLVSDHEGEEIVIKKIDPVDSDGRGIVYKVEVSDGKILALKVYTGEQQLDHSKPNFQFNGFYTIQTSLHEYHIQNYSSAGPKYILTDCIKGTNLREDVMSCIDLDGSDDDIEEKVYFVECSDCKKYIEVDKNTRDIFSSNINFYCYNLPDRRCGE